MVYSALSTSAGRDRAASIAGTSPGSDWSGIRPESSLTARDRPPGAISKAPKDMLALIRPHALQRTPATNGAWTGVTWVTWGMRDRDGSG